jgi:hypothetical protein
MKLREELTMKLLRIFALSVAVFLCGYAIVFAAQTAIAFGNISSNQTPVLTVFVSPFCSGTARAISGTNAVDVAVFTLPSSLTFTKMGPDIGGVDTGNLYSYGITTLAGVVKAHTAAAGTIGFSSNTDERALVETSVTLPAGQYLWAITGNSTTATFGTGASAGISAFTTSTTSTSGAFPGSLSVTATAAGGASVGQRNTPCFILR